MSEFVKKLQLLLFDWHPLNLAFFALKWSAGRTRLTTVISFHWENHLRIHSDLLQYTCPTFFRKTKFKYLLPLLWSVLKLFDLPLWSLILAAWPLPCFIVQSLHRNQKKRISNCLSSCIHVISWVIFHIKNKTKREGPVFSTIFLSDISGTHLINKEYYLNMQQQVHS